MENQDQYNLDNFIKKQTTADPQVPKDLNLEWEKMNIDFPNKKNDIPEIDQFAIVALNETIEVPKELNLSWDEMEISTPSPKKKNKGFILFFLLSILLIIIYSDYHFMSVEEKPMVNENGIELNDLQTSRQTNILEKKNIGSSINEKIVDSKIDTEQKLEIQNQKNTQSKNSTPISASENKSLSNAPIINEIIEPELNRPQLTHFSAEPKVSPSKKSTTLLSLSALNRDFDLRLKFNRIVPEIPKGSINPALKNKKPGASGSIYIKMGKNLGQVRFRNNIELENKLESKIGRNIEAGIDFNMKKNFSWTLGLNYDELHTVFTHSRVISKTIIPGSNTYQVVCEHTYQNNFNRYIGFNLGMAKPISTFKKSKLRTSISIQGNYMISQKGLTLNDGEIVNLNDVEISSGMNLLLNPTMEYVQFISSNLSLSTFYKASFGLGRGLDLADDISASFIHQVGFGLYYNY